MSNKTAYSITIFGMVQFFVLTVVAMFFYPGGTIEETSLGGYSFFENKFSDLGMITAYNGTANTISMILFSIALVVVGLSFIPFVMATDNILIEKANSKILVRVGSVFGVLAGLGFSGVGLTPKDLDWAYISHFLTQYVAFVAALIMGICYSIAILKDNAMHKKTAIIYITCAVLQFVYLFILFKIIPFSNTFKAIAQKLIVYIQIITYLTEAIWGMKLSSEN